ncbi:MAG TPA: hypothetical protein VL899_02520 [Alphaproteobacteria bacterium]|nr:hypothetical protein [Alphaproteobacteria bacterium]
MCPAVANPDQLPTGEVAALTSQRLAELDRLRNMGMARMEMLDASLDLVPRERQWEVLLGRNGQAAQFDRICRAVRQIVVLEFELRGLFRGPDRTRFGLGLALPLADADENDLDDLRDPDERKRDSRGEGEDLRDRSDYRRGPLDEVVAGIRKTLGAEPPQNDPFAPPPDRKPAQAAFPAKPASRGLPDGAKPRRPGMQAKPTAKTSPVSAPAMPTVPRKGFRQPPTSPHNPGTHARNGRRNRGPPA